MITHELWAAAQLAPGEGIEDGVNRVANILARIDAERGKEAVAWFAFADNNGPVPLELLGFDEKACKYSVLENARSIGWKGTIEGYLLHMRWTIRPLFISAPTIPPSKESGDHYACGWNACRDAMIAAAQGERK